MAMPPAHYPGHMTKANTCSYDVIVTVTPVYTSGTYSTSQAYQPKLKASHRTECA